MILKHMFHNLLMNYTDNESFIEELWLEIEENHSSNKRHYHTLTHLENLLNQLVDVKQDIENWDVILFTLFYHDSIYRAEKNNNEDKSSKLAEKRMKQLAVQVELIERCKQQILATKSHALSAENDVNYFNDADLSILGQDWESYSMYYQNVRKEYAIYPDFLYNPGRIKVLNHFLTMDRIFKTDHFSNRFEAQAKQNLLKEIEVLKS